MVDIYLITTIVMSALSALLIGSLWYHPKIFGTAWLRLVNISPKDLEKRKKYMPLLMLVSFIMFLCVAFMVSIIISVDISQIISNTVFDQTILNALLIWISLVVPVLLWSVFWEGKSIKLFAINAGYWLVVLYAMSLILDTVVINI